jgi:hypothetical protein
MGGYSPTYDERKLKELILYVADRSRDDVDFDVKKLTAILYYADFDAYRRLGSPISGADYQKFPEGPAPRQFPLARESLLADGLIAIAQRPGADRDRQRITATQPFERGWLSKDELSVVEDVLADLRQKTGREAADLSRGEPGWKMAGDNETIPYTTAWLSSQPLTPDQLEKARRVVKKHELLGR